jgi:hypothetical protein
MPNYERGVYEPSDEVRIFDGTEEDEDIEGSRLPLLIVLALLVLAMFAGLVWLAYTQGVARGRSETPVLAAAAGPVRVAPTDKDNGGADAAYKGFKIYEQPAPPDDEADAAPPATPAATQTPPPAPAKAQPAPVVAAPQPVAAPAPAPAKPAPALKPVVATPKPAPMMAAPKPAPAAEKPKPVISAPLAPATGAPRALPGLASTAPVAAAPKPAASGSYVLQIGAYKSQADADAAWKAYKAKHAALLAGYGSDVQQAELGEKGTWYRLRITGFGDRDVANGLCDRLKADGGSCFLGR